MDPGLPVRLGDPAVRRHRRTGVARAGPLPDARTDGPARQPRRRARPWLQQRQHVRQPAAAGPRGPLRRRAVGSPLLRAGAESQRRHPGAPVDARFPAAGSSTRSTARTRCSWTRCARSARSRSPTRSVTGCQTSRTRRSACSNGCSSTPARRRTSASTTAATAITTTSAAGWCTRACSTRRTAAYRGPSTQQGYSPFSTWTRGLAWAMLGFAEELEFLATESDDALAPFGGRARDRALDARRRDARPATSTSSTPRRLTACPTGTPGRPASPRSATGHSRAVRSVQRPRAGRQLCRGDRGAGAAPARTSARRARRRWRALHAGRARGARDAHRSGGPVPLAGCPVIRDSCSTRSTIGRTDGTRCRAGSRIPRGESCQWGDYHLREAALYVKRLDRRTVPDVLWR